MRSPLLRSLVVVTALAPVLAPSLAQACWDGVAMSTDKLTIARHDTTTWSPEDARRWAKWVARIDALLPDDVHLDVFDGDATLCDGDGNCAELGQGLTPFALFERTADHVDATRGAIASARRIDDVPFTVQVAASHDLAAAHDLAAKINAAALGLHGFYEAGGFPAMNDYAHVVEATTTDTVTYHVVVGAFLAASEAESARDIVDAELGLHGFVRRLDQSSIAEEGC